MSSRLGFIAGLAALVFAIPAARAVDLPRQVADLRSVPNPFEGSRPHGFASLHGVALFAAQAGDHGDRLYRSDGTAEGTIELAQPCPSPQDGSISLWASTGARAYYTVMCSGTYAYELWSTDGTPSGTWRILGPGEFRPPAALGPNLATVAEGGRMLFLQGGDYASQLELWSTDGSVAGTSRIATISVEYVASGAISRRGPNDYVLMVRSEYEGFSVWRSDGTEQGTTAVVALPFQNYYDSVRAIVATSLGFAFAADRDMASDELWHTDGTAAGTGIVATFHETSWESLAVLDGSIYLAARFGSTSAIVRSEGTVATTRALALLDPAILLPTRIELDGGWLYFLASDDSWEAGSVLRVPAAGGAVESVREICSGGYCTEMNPALWFRLVAGRLVFSRKEDDRLSVWVSAANGSDAEPIAELCSGDACFVASVRPERVNEGLLFATTSEEDGSRDLWLTDGNAEISRRIAGPLAAIPWNGLSSESGGVVAGTGGGWLFAAADELHALEPWMARASADASRMVLDLRLDRPGPDVIESIAFTGSEVLFSAWDAGDTRTLFRREIGGEGAEPFLTVPILAGRHGSSNGPPTFHAAGNAWFFVERPEPDAGEGSPRQVWRFDPLSKDTRALFADPATDGIGTIANELHERGGDAFLLGSSGADFRPALFKVRPLSGQTVKWLDVPADSAVSLGRSGDVWFLLENGYRLTVFDLALRERRLVKEFDGAESVFGEAFQDGALLVVRGLDPASGSPRTTLWQSDGTAAGTREIETWLPGWACDFWITLPAASAEGPQLFSIDPICGGPAELWTTDGSDRRTRRLLALESGTFILPQSGVRFRGESYFFSSRESGSCYLPPIFELWRTDGTPEGTTIVASLPSSYSGYPYAAEAVAGGRAIHFGWVTEDAGIELWRSDGTAAGTALEADLQPGSPSSYPRSLRTVGDQVLFLAERPDVGLELWQTDGELASPQLVADLYQGAEGSTPWIIAASDDALYIHADDGVVGRELWEVTAPSVSPCDRGSDLCLLGDRFRTRAVWRDFEGRSGAATPVALTGESGYFWFFDPSSPELLAKVVDACGLPGFENFWAFTTGLTNVEVELEIVDTWSGERSALANPMGHKFVPSFDTGSFEVCGPVGSGVGAPAQGTGPAPGADRLALLGGRFEITADWVSGDGEAGRGTAVPLADGSGYFWFFTPSNVELFVKMADACGLEGFENYWLFAAGLTDLEVVLRAHDVLSGETAVYRARPGRPFLPILDTGRFRTCGE